jgi:hypothetical protein
MKYCLLAIAFLALGCTISPVVSDPRERSSEVYSDCRRAAKDYCREVVNAPSNEVDRCVADYAYRCTSGAR